MKKFYVIKCPKCGWEYLPEDIYIKILSNPKGEMRDENGRILFFEGETMDLHEEYTCDHCNCTFSVDMKPAFDTKVVVEHDFSEDYSTPIYSEDRFELEEPKGNTKGLW